MRKLLILAAAVASVAAAKAPEKSVEVVTTETLDYSAGVVRVENAYGQLNVEAWDEPKVEVTVTRTSFTHGEDYLKKIQVKVKKGSDGGVEITSSFPGRNRVVRAIWGLGDFNLDYRIKAPRNAKLAIAHGVGDVVIHDIAGEIAATVKSGDIVLQLPDPETYSIDARVTIGTIYTDYDGTHRSPWLVGQKFDGGTGRSIQLRVGVGGISIQKVRQALPPAKTF